MLRNYLTIALRGLRQQKKYALINMLGLSVGLAAVILVLLFVRDELSYDTFHQKKDRIYRVTIAFLQDGEFNEQAITPYRLAPALSETFGDIEQIARIDDQDVYVAYDDKRFLENKVMIADSSLFEIFTFEWIEGDPASALQAPFTVVITESIARKYFGDASPIDKTLRVRDTYDVLVKGVIKDMPTNSHFHANIFISMTSGDQIYPDIVLNNWGEGSQYTYLLLPENYPAEKLIAQFPEFIHTHIGEEAPDYVQVGLQPLMDIHLRSHLRMELGANGDIRYVYIFGAIALFILLIACINYMNLATARSLTRAKEVGLRKVIGAQRKQIVFQFLGEAILISLFSLIIAIILAEITLPFFNQLAGKQMHLTTTDNLSIFLVLILLAIGVGLISGSYPALFLSGFQPIKIFKKQLGESSSSQLRLRKVLVVLQFTISIFLIVGTLTVNRQLSFLQNKKLGFDREHLILLPIPLDSVQNDYEAFKNEILRNPHVTLATASNKRLTRGLTSNLDYQIEGIESNPEGETSLKTITCDPDFFKTLGVKVLEGRDFDKTRRADLENAFILNQSAVKSLGLSDPIGKRVSTYTLSPDITWLDKSGYIIGVVEDFHFEPLSNTIKPVAYHLSDSWLNWMSIRVAGDHIPEALAHVEATHYQFAPDQDFSYSFLEEDIMQLYHTEARVLKIATTFCILAIFIACLGILGLAAYSTQQRAKEIGIRKVLGASLRDILRLLTKEIVLLVLIAGIAGSILGGFAMNQWLSDFPYRIDLNLTTFLLAILSAMIVALITIMTQVLRIAQINPIQVIQYE